MSVEPTPPYPGPASSVAERLRWARIFRGYASPRKAAIALYFKEETYRSHEMGRRGGVQGLKQYYVRRYAKAFNVNAVWLQTGEGSPTAIGPSEITPQEIRLIEAFRATMASS